MKALFEKYPIGPVLALIGLLASLSLPAYALFRLYSTMGGCK